MSKLIFHLKKLFSIFTSILNTPKFGFVQGHNYIDNKVISELYQIIGTDGEEIILKFEQLFSNLIGSGSSVSFASGRMGFYALMKACGIGRGDEIIINGATCSVMINAILRCNAIPVYSDIDPNTFGSSAQSIQKCLSERTKMVVAQHSFGIPCEVNLIANICRDANIFLLEDCALALGSTLNNINVGTFGDAALFSTDHSKPLNTIIGGLIYTNKTSIYKKLRKVQSQSSNLPVEKQKMIWSRFLLERKFAQPGRYRLLQFFDFISQVKRRLIGEISPFLDEDFGSKITPGSYPYPSRFPAFLAAIGILEINRWSSVKKDRERMLSYYTEWVKHHNFNIQLPSVYYDSHRNITPLRIVWSQANGEIIRQQLENVINISWIWFKQPIITTFEPLENFSYKHGDCPISEHIGIGMVNLPTSVSFEDFLMLLEMVSLALNNRKLQDMVSK